MNRKYLALFGSVVAVAMAVPAQAGVELDGYTLDEGTFGAQTGVHSTGAQSGTTVNGYVNQDGSGVTFTSSTTLTLNGSGEAVVEPVAGSITDLLVLFEKAWDNVTFSFDGDPGTFTLAVNGGSLFDSGNCSICTIAKGQNKFTVSGAGITSLAFTFDPGISTARQFRVEGLTAPVPEPATWAMMLFGFGAVGFGMRRRRAQGTQKLRVRFAI